MINTISSDDYKDLSLKEKWEDPRFCNSLYLVLGNLISKKTTKYFLLITLTATEGILFYYDFKGDPYNIASPHRNTFLITIINILFIISIVHFMFISKNIGFRIDNLKYAFADRKNFQDYSQAYYEWISLGEGKYKNDRKVNNLFLWFFRIAYITFWLAVCASFVYYGVYKIHITSYKSGWFTIILFVISISLLAYGLFTLITYVLFLHNLSCSENQSRLSTYKYNHLLPSHTFGFNQLVSDVNGHTLCFIPISILYAASFPLLVSIHTTISIEGIMQTVDFTNIVMLVLYLFLSFIMGFFVYPIPKYMLRRILSIWIDTSTKRLETNILSWQEEISILSQTDSKKKSQRINSLEKKIDIYENYIKNLKADKSLFRKDIIPTIIVVLEFLAPIVSFVFSSFLKKFALFA